MRAAILVPFRPDGGARSRNWVYARRWWYKIGWPVLTGDSSPADHRLPFERAAARNAAARLAGDWDVAVFSDADIVLASQAQAISAAYNAYKTGEYTVAYSRLNYLNEQGTHRVVVYDDDPASVEQRDEPIELTWECCFAVRRDIFDQVGGFDERFRGWGGQVAAFFYAYATFGGRERIHGDAYHLDHPLVDRSQEPHLDESLWLAERYKAAVDDHEAMTRILGER